MTKSLERELESRLTEMLNLVNSYIGHGRQDGAFATLREALELSQQNDLPVWKFVFTYQGCLIFNQEFFPVDHARFVRQLVAQAVENADYLTARPEFRRFGPVVEGLIDGLPDDPSLALKEEFSRVRELFSADFDVMMVLEPPISEVLPDSVMNGYRALAAVAHFKFPEAVDESSVARLHESLAHEIAGSGLRTNIKHNLLREVHRNAMQAGQMIDHPPLILAGAVGLLRHPRLWNAVTRSHTCREHYP